MLLTLDWETAYGKSPTGRDVTLSRMTTEEYIRDPEFKIHGLGVKLNDRPAKYIYKTEELVRFLKTCPWHKAVVLAHHAHFDMAILFWKCGIRPKFICDTLSMFRALYPHESSSLGNMAKVLDLGEKGTELQNVKDKWALTEQEQRILGGYCINDVDLTFKAFQTMKQGFPLSELQLIDHTVRLFAEPVIEINPVPLIEDYKRERRRKHKLIKECIADKTQLSSNDKFAQVLLTAGIDPPKKLSPSKIKDGRVDPDNAGDAPQGLLPAFKTPKKPSKREGEAAEAAWEAEKTRIKEAKDKYPWAYAFGKSDEQFKLLLDHPDLKIQALVEARIGVKSTIKETRSKRFYKIGKRGAFPVYLNYYGAHTGRYSGGDKQNAQNLTRVNPEDPESGALRKSWVAPEGHLVVVRDLGQIEARVLAYWAGQEDLLDLFRVGGDPYNRQASLIFGYEVNRKLKEHFVEGLAGKASMLGNGYGGGWAMLQEKLRVGFMGMPPLLFGPEEASKLGADMDSFCAGRSYKKQYRTLMDEALAMKPLNVSEEEHLWHCAAVKMIVDKYRGSNASVVALWKELQHSLGLIVNEDRVQVGQRGLVYTCPEGLTLPNGMIIRYHKLRQTSSGEFKYLANRKKKDWAYLYGGKACENGTQALARIILTDQMREIMKRIKGYTLRSGEILKVVTTTHDEIVAIAPERLADSVYRMMGEEMGRAPAWCADLPLKSSGGYAKNYGDCEK